MLSFPAFLLTCATTLDALCIEPYPDHIIDYIIRNPNDSSVYYLGEKQSTTDCLNHCIDFNYICDKSLHNTYIYSDGGDFQFDNKTCSITADEPSRDRGSFAILTPDIDLNEYVIELQMLDLSEMQVGIIFKAMKQPLYHHCYIFVVDSASSYIIAYSNNEYWIDEDLISDGSITYDTVYNLSVHVMGNTFSAYANDDHIYDGVFDEVFTGNYAGVLLYGAGATFNSFMIKDPNANDQSVQFCNAYMYDKSNGDCYGYYGNDYTVIENSVQRNVTQRYDSGIVYNSSCTLTTSQTQSTTDFTSDNYDTFNLTKLMKVTETSNSPRNTISTENDHEYQHISTENDHEYQQKNNAVNAKFILIGCLLIVVTSITLVLIISIWKFKCYKRSRDEIHLKQTHDEIGVEDQTQNIEVKATSGMNAVYVKRRNRNALEVQYWLENVVQLSQYYDIFISNGYESLDIVKEIMNITELMEIGIESPRHQAKLLQEIAELVVNRNERGRPMWFEGNVMMMPTQEGPNSPKIYKDVETDYIDK